MSTAEKIAVTFLKGWRGYNTGETAGFDPEVAEKLVTSEVAKAAAPVDKGASRGRATAKGAATVKGAETATAKGSDDSGSDKDDAAAGGSATAQAAGGAAGSNDERP